MPPPAFAGSPAVAGACLASQIDFPPATNRDEKGMEGLMRGGIMLVKNTNMDYGP